MIHRETHRHTFLLASTIVLIGAGCRTCEFPKGFECPDGSSPVAECAAEHQTETEIEASQTEGYGIFNYQDDVDGTYYCVVDDPDLYNCSYALGDGYTQSVHSTNDEDGYEIIGFNVDRGCVSELATVEVVSDSEGTEEFEWVATVPEDGSWTIGLDIYFSGVSIPDGLSEDTDGYKPLTVAVHCGTDDKEVWTWDPQMDTLYTPEVHEEVECSLEEGDQVYVYVSHVLFDPVEITDGSVSMNLNP